MATNVYCEHCEKEVGKGDAFVVVTPERVRAYHFKCAGEIYNAMQLAIMRGNE